MNKNIALTVAGLVFLLVALGHLFRLIIMAQINIAGYMVPMWPSYVGFIVTLILAFWMFAATKK